MQATKPWDVCIYVAHTNDLYSGVCVGGVTSDLEPVEYVRVNGVLGAHELMLYAAKEAGAPFDKADLLRRLIDVRNKLTRHKTHIVFYPTTLDKQWMMMVWLRRVEETH